jgi:hypothetical protein
MRGQLQR